MVHSKINIWLFKEIISGKGEKVIKKRMKKRKIKSPRDSIHWKSVDGIEWDSKYSIESILIQFISLSLKQCYGPNQKKWFSYYIVLIHFNLQCIWIAYNYIHQTKTFSVLLFIKKNEHFSHFLIHFLLFFRSFLRSDVSLCVIQRSTYSRKITTKNKSHRRL